MKADETKAADAAQGKDDQDWGSGSSPSDKPEHASEVAKDDPHKVEKLSKMGRDVDSDAASE